MSAPHWDDDEWRAESAGLAPLAVICLASVLAGGIGITLFVLAGRAVLRHLLGGS